MFLYLGNEIYGSACGDDDEDCGSSSGSNSIGNTIPFGKIIRALHDPLLHYCMGLMWLINLEKIWSVVIAVLSWFIGLCQD